MRKVLLISLSLVLALVGGSAACAEDGFYVIGGGAKRNYAPVPKTGQYVFRGIFPNIVPGYEDYDDSWWHKGVTWPTPRFTDNNNGTVTDNLTKLIWTKEANAFGNRTWVQALSDANSLHSGHSGLTDGSQAGDWRLPNVRELQSLIAYGYYGPALPNTLGTGQWAQGDPFQVLNLTFGHWSSTTYTGNATRAWRVDFSGGSATYYDKSLTNSVWCVRGGP